jgi:hypothetical protein
MDDPDRPLEAFAKAWAEAQRPAAKAAYAVSSAFDACDMFAAVLADDRFVSAEMMREALTPALILCQRPPVEPARQRHIRTWLDMVAASWSLQQAVEDVEGAPADLPLAGSAPSDHLPPPVVTPTDSAASAELLRAAIAAGDNVVELPGGIRLRRERKPK